MAGKMDRRGFLGLLGALAALPAAAMRSAPPRRELLDAANDGLVPGPSAPNAPLQFGTSLEDVYGDGRYFRVVYTVGGTQLPEPLVIAARPRWWKP